MKKKLNVLVTGAAGDIGQSICKILKSDVRFNKVIGTDLLGDHLGKFIFDEVKVVPRSDDQNYKTELSQIINQFGIDILIPGSEPELKYFQCNPFPSHSPFEVVHANPEALEVGFDKFLTAIFLQKNSLPFPITELVNEETNWDIPFIAKAREGSGSKSVYLVKEEIDWAYIKTKHKDFIVQEYIDGDDQEYTCGLFRSRKGEIRSVLVKRRLMSGSGLTGVGEIVKDNEIDLLLSKIATGLNLIGSINVQLRKSDKGPMVFEINPRFSSTVLFRHLLGFQDLIWSIEDMMGETLSDYTAVPEGKKFYRGYQEYFED